MIESVFTKHTGRETKVTILEEKEMPRGGNSARIFDTLAEVGGVKKRFIVKKYTYRLDNFQDPEGDERMAMHAFENYGKAKIAGLKVFPTFRLGEDKKSILMTTGLKPGEVCVGSNSSQGVIEKGLPLIEEVSNLDDFLSSIFTEAKKMSQMGLILQIDAPFFFVSKTKPTKISFVLGDLDNLDSTPEFNKKTDWAKLRINNLNNLSEILNEFCEKNIAPSYKRIFLSKVKEYRSNFYI